MSKMLNEAEYYVAGSPRKLLKLPIKTRTSHFNLRSL